MNWDRILVSAFWTVVGAVGTFMGIVIVEYVFLGGAELPNIPNWLTYGLSAVGMIAGLGIPQLLYWREKKVAQADADDEDDEEEELHRPAPTPPPAVSHGGSRWTIGLSAAALFVALAAGYFSWDASSQMSGVQEQLGAKANQEDLSRFGEVVDGLNNSVVDFESRVTQVEEKTNTARVVADEAKELAVRASDEAIAAHRNSIEAKRLAKVMEDRLVQANTQAVARDSNAYVRLTHYERTAVNHNKELLQKVDEVRGELIAFKAEQWEVNNAQDSMITAFRAKLHLSDKDMEILTEGIKKRKEKKEKEQRAVRPLDYWPGSPSQ